MATATTTRWQLKGQGYLPGGFIWSRGQCGQGSFRASAVGLSVAADKKNWIYYDFDWSNAKK